MKSDRECKMETVSIQCGTHAGTSRPNWTMRRVDSSNARGANCGSILARQPLVARALIERPCTERGPDCSAGEFCCRYNGRREMKVKVNVGINCKPGKRPTTDQQQNPRSLAVRGTNFSWLRRCVVLASPCRYAQPALGARFRNCCHGTRAQRGVDGVPFADYQYNDWRGNWAAAFVPVWTEVLVGVAGCHDFCVDQHATHQGAWKLAGGANHGGHRHDPECPGGFKKRGT